MDIRVSFGDFWDGFDPNNNIWVWILRQKHNIILDDKNPQLVFTMGENKHPSAYVVYYSNEPFFPDLDSIDSRFNYSMGNFFIDKQNYTRFPSYYMYINQFIENGLISDFSFFNKENREIPHKTHFCSFVSRGLNGRRGEFFHKLNKYKPVETNVFPYNNFNIPFDNSQFNSSKPKIEFIKKYKFNLAFENNFRGSYQCFPNAKVENGHLLDMGGFISEKLIEPFISGVIPIYWGSEMVSTEFNSKTFLNRHDFKSDEELIDFIIELDKNDTLYQSYFNEKILVENNNVLSYEYVINLLDDIVKNIA